ncbi:hypothetical protein ANN_22700 [Periplaneta americana]|uniref:RNase H type-1 domain-containing protein n=1 Tax=Periplaneta americana TaxID=6978 RepID=A0ABQ8S8U5_PERAM|nr:hypothetical protein ANN_22700 [Periplaneta americana]
MLRRIWTSNKNISIVWVPSHTGLTGNEKIYTFVKMAADQGMITASFLTPPEDITQHERHANRTEYPDNDIYKKKKTNHDISTTDYNFSKESDLQLLQNSVTLRRHPPTYSKFDNVTTTSVNANKFLVSDFDSQYNCSTFIPTYQIYTKWILHNIDKDISTEDILHHGHSLEGYKITNAYRFNRKITTQQGTQEWEPKTTVLITFRSQKLPNELKLFDTIHKLYKYKEKVLQCRNCQRFGHSFKYCRNGPVCLKCSDDHQAKECQVTKYKCSNCALAHMANSTDCPQYKTEVTVLEEIESLKISRYDAIANIKERKTFSNITAQLVAHQVNTRDPLPTLSLFSRFKSTEPQQPPTLTESIKSNVTQVLKRRLGTPPATTPASKSKKEQPSMTQKLKKAYKGILIPSQHRNPTIF